MNLTLEVDDALAERAHAAAQAMGTSLDQFLRSQIDRLAGLQQRMADHNAFEERCLRSAARLHDWKFKRDEANERD